jgi:hypothetical protein
MAYTEVYVIAHQIDYACGHAQLQVELGMLLLEVSKPRNEMSQAAANGAGSVSRTALRPLADSRASVAAWI